MAAQIRVSAGRSAGFKMAVIARARYAAELAQMLDFRAALRLLSGHGFDDREDAVAMGFGIPAASVSRKAC